MPFDSNAGEHDWEYLELQRGHLTWYWTKQNQSTLARVGETLMLGNIKGNKKGAVKRQGGSYCPPDTHMKLQELKEVVTDRQCWGIISIRSWRMESDRTNEQQLSGRMGIQDEI